MTTPWTRRYAQRMQWMGSSVIRQLLKLTEQPDIISFAGGLPAPELFPVKAVAEATKKVLAEHGSQALQYSTTEGYGPLRELIVERMRRYGIPARPENVLLTSGSQQALDLIGKLLINPGDLILTEEPSYLGALQAWRAYQAEFVTVPIDDDGLCCTNLLEEALCAGPKFMYILPNFHNPAGVTLSAERRQRIIGAGGGHHTLRLNFSNARPEMIELGIRRLGEVFAAELERGSREVELAPTQAGISRQM